MVRANGVRPIEYELMMRDMYLKDESLASPDLKHIAVVTRWLFGPEDVMILTQEE